MTVKLDKETALAIRDECLLVSQTAIGLFDSLEENELNLAGARAAAEMANHALAIRHALSILSAAQLMHLRGV